MAQVASTSPAVQPAAPPPEDPTFGPLERASKALDERLARDDRWVGVGDSLGGATSSDYVVPPNPAWAPFQKTRTVLLPDRLFEEHDLTHSRCTMGLLPEIERSWVTVDHCLLLWDWADGSSFSSFDELTDVIVGVGLVKPRPGVFVDSISHLLVLATPNQITLVGLGYVAPSPGAKREITFYLTGLTVPTDGVSLVTIRGTANGRIFLSSSPEPLTPGGIGGDGCLYELVYQSSEGWFVKRCALYNLTSGSVAKAVMPTFLRSLSAVAANEWIISLEVDNERGLLYTLLQSGTIEMYQLPSTFPGSGFDGQPVRVAKCHDILRQALAVCPGSPMLNARNFKIVAFEVISVKESGSLKVGLVAITSAGVRIYFSHQRRGYTMYYAPSSQPTALELCHVRPPPTPAATPPPIPNAFYGQPPPPPAQGTTIAFNSIIQAKYSTGGLFIAANNVDTDHDVVLLTAPDVATAARAIADGAPATNTNGSVIRPLSEVAGSIDIPGRTWDMAEITPAGSAPAAKGGTGLNELATQATQPRREWVILTNMGANVIARQRPVDTLLDVLEAASMSGNGAHGEVGLFFESYGRDQACAMLLTIAASNSRITRVEPSAGFASSGRNASTAVAEQAKSLFFEGGGRPVSIDRGGFASGPQGTASDSKIVYSGRHEGLAFYFARLLRPLWKEKITRPAPTLEDKTRQAANVSESTLTSVQRDLISLRSFVEQEQHLFTLLPDGGRSNQPPVAYQAEQASLAGLRLLLTQSVEAISFVLLLIDYKISDVIAQCPVDQQKALQTLTYQGLLTSKVGRDVARELVGAIISQQIGRQLSVDAISDTLQQRCGSFCSADDVLLYKAAEAIQRASDTTGRAEQIDGLRESLRLFSKAAKHMTLESLKQTCAEYNSMQFPLGVIDLALTCAREWDPSERGVSFWLDGLPPNDARGAAYDLRNQCNELVFSALKECDEDLNRATQPNQPSASQKRLLSYEEADGLRTNAYNKALSVKDEFFHSALYDWYLAHGITDQLLETRAPYLEAYLSRQPSTLQKADLLWQYYVRTTRYADAASVLASLAETLLFPLAIHKRVEYLSLAVGNAKSQFSSNRSDSVQFLTDVEEKLEVSQVQIEIYCAIQESDLEPEAKKAMLEQVEERLYTISELYSLFAAPLGLLEINLLIFHVSDHRDPEMVAETWEGILEQAHSVTPDQPFESVRAKVVSLTRRFLGSDVAFPLPYVIPMLELYTLNHRREMPSGWLPLALHEAGIPWEAIFTELDTLFSSKSPPWQTNAALVFLASDLAILLVEWVKEATSSHSSSLYAVEYPFPATRVDRAIGNYLNDIGTNGEVGVKLQEVQREVNRRF